VKDADLLIQLFMTAIARISSTNAGDMWVAWEKLWRSMWVINVIRSFSSFCLFSKRANMGVKGADELNLNSGVFAEAQTVTLLSF